MVAMWTLLFLAAVATAAVPDDARTTYTTRFDSIDLDRILSSRRLVKNYVDCLLGRKRCPPEGAELKRVLPDALATRCAKCSERQREAAVRAIGLLRERYPDLWAPLQEKWDPTGEHTRRLEQATARRAAASSVVPAAPARKAAPVHARVVKTKRIRTSAGMTDANLASGSKPMEKDASSVPVVPAVPIQPSVPSSAAAVHAVPTIPSIPPIPSIPSISSIPAIPSIPSIPYIPGIPAAVSVERSVAVPVPVSISIQESASSVPASPVTVPAVPASASVSTGMRVSEREMEGAPRSMAN